MSSYENDVFSILAVSEPADHGLFFDDIVVVAKIFRQYELRKTSHSLHGLHRPG